MCHFLMQFKVVVRIWRALIQSREKDGIQIVQALGWSRFCRTEFIAVGKYSMVQVVCCR